MNNTKDSNSVSTGPNIGRLFKAVEKTESVPLVAPDISRLFVSSEKKVPDTILEEKVTAPKTKKKKFQTVSLSDLKIDGGTSDGADDLDQTEEPHQPITVDEPIEEAPVKEIPDKPAGKPVAILTNGFENGNGVVEKGRFNEYDQVVVRKASGTYQREENSKPINIVADMIGSKYTFLGVDDKGLAYLEDESGSGIYVPESSLGSFSLIKDETKKNETAIIPQTDKAEILESQSEDLLKIKQQLDEQRKLDSAGQKIVAVDPPLRTAVPEPINEPAVINEDLKKELVDGVDKMADGDEFPPNFNPVDINAKIEHKEKFDGGAVSIPGENGSIEIAPDQLWSLPSEGKNGIDDYIIEDIKSVDDKNLEIKFVDLDPLDRTIAAWSEIFSAGHLQPDKIDIQAGDNIGESGQVAGAVNEYQNGKIVKTETSIPTVEITNPEVVKTKVAEEAEIDKTRKDIVGQVEAAAPEAAAEDQVEEAGEEGEPAPGKPGDIVPDGYEPFIRAGDPNQVDANSAASLERTSPVGQVAVDENG